jgi:hypothetical protein
MLDGLRMAETTGDATGLPARQHSVARSRLAPAGPGATNGNCWPRGTPGPTTGSAVGDGSLTKTRLGRCANIGPAHRTHPWSLS